MKMLSVASSSVSSALLRVASSSKGSAQAGGAIVAAQGLPRLGRVDLCTRWAASSLSRFGGLLYLRRSRRPSRLRIQGLA